MLVQLSVRIDGRESGVIEQLVSGTADEVEEQVREIEQRVGRMMLEPAFQQIADLTPAPCCCGRTMKNCGLRTIGILTMCGEVPIHRRRYRCRCQECGHELHPADARLCCGRHRVSRPLAQRVCQLAAVEHFTRLPELINAQHGVTLGHETILELVHDVGGAAERMRLAEALSSISRRVVAPVTQINPPKRIYVSVDGIMYCTNQTESDPDHPGQKRLIWQQMKVGCVYWQDGHERWHKQMVWGREAPEEFGGALWRLACQCGYVQADERVFAADGGSWCWDIHARYFSDAIGLLDWYHASEHVWDTAKCVAPDAVQTWTQTALDYLHDGGGEALVTWLTIQISSRRGGPRVALEKLTRYFSEKIHQLNYPAARQRGWQIGTGMIESTCKQLVGQRLKGPGMHWTEAGALAVTALRATDLNGKWTSFWKNLNLAN